MKFTALCTFLSLCAASQALLRPIAPIAATEWDARRSQIVEWEDDGNEPLLRDTSNVAIQLFTGSTYQQSFLQDLTGDRTINGRRGSVAVRFDRSVGPDGQYYFLRFRSDDLTEDVFSAIFILDHMTGEFNSTIQAQLTASGSLGAAPTIPASSSGVRTAQNDAVPTSAPSSAISTGSRLPAGPSIVRSAVVESSASALFLSKGLVASGALLVASFVFLL